MESVRVGHTWEGGALRAGLGLCDHVLHLPQYPAQPPQVHAQRAVVDALLAACQQARAMRQTQSVDMCNNLGDCVCAIGRAPAQMRVPQSSPHL